MVCLAAVGNSLGLDAFGRRFTRDWVRQDGAPCPIFHRDRRSTTRAIAAEVINVRTIDIADIADVTFLAKTTVHTRMMADDDVIIDDGDPRPGHCA